MIICMRGCNGAPPRYLHGAGGAGPVPRAVPALDLRGGQGHVRALQLRGLPRHQQQLPHAGGLPEHL